MTQTTKNSNRKVVVALAVLCIITLVGLNFSVITYYSGMNTKNAQIKTLNGQLENMETQVSNLTLLTATPKVIGIGMNYTDNRTNPIAPFLLVTGFVCNVGATTANNCTLHVSAIQNENKTAINTAVTFNSLAAGTWEAIDIRFPYTGEPIIAYSAYFDWTP